MPIVKTHLLTPGPQFNTRQIYNCLDACITFEVFEAISKLNNRPPEIYDFFRALQAPALEMSLRGWHVDSYERQKAIASLEKKLDRLYFILNSYAQAVWDRPLRKQKSTGRELYLNPSSRPDMLAFFLSIRENKDKSLTYLPEGMHLPVVYTSKKGVRQIAMDREALEKLEVHFFAMPVVAAILAIRELSKQLSTLKTQVDPDGRMRTSYNIVGATTDRWSSSASVTGTGSNLQNIDPQLRIVFDADPGLKIAAIDLEQAEAREVGWIIGSLFGDWSYLDGCERGDLHTTTCRLIWPDLGWSGDLKKDRAIAEQNFYRHFTYRDMAKRGGHGSSYYGTPFTMARHLKVPVKLMTDFQRGFFGAYPGIPKWHRWVAQELQTTQQITNNFGRVRHFFGRPNDDTTLREAIAHGPQSSTAERANLGLWRIWKHMGQRVKILHQNHDAVYFLYREIDEAEVLPQALKLMEVTLVHASGRVFTIPGEVKVGWNWGAHHDPSKPTSGRNAFNPNGLTKWKGPGSDKRTRLTGLHRPI